jgi:hypothetical protein
MIKFIPVEVLVVNAISSGSALINSAIAARARSRRINQSNQRLSPDSKVS